LYSSSSFFESLVLISRICCSLGGAAASVAALFGFLATEMPFVEIARTRRPLMMMNSPVPPRALATAAAASATDLCWARSIGPFFGTYGASSESGLSPLPAPPFAGLASDFAGAFAAGAFASGFAAGVPLPAVAPFVFALEDFAGSDFAAGAFESAGFAPEAFPFASFAFGALPVEGLPLEGLPLEGLPLEGLPPFSARASSPRAS
jgi:hypothetical protein